MVEKIKQNTYLTESKVSAKDNKNKKGEVTSQSYSTVIPKPILTKLGLQKGQILYWDINEENDIIITPEINPVPTPEEASIEAGLDIFNEMLHNGYTSFYISSLNKIKSELENPETTNEETVNRLIHYYNNIVGNKRYGSLLREKDDFKKLLLYLLDYPLNIPQQFEILREVYNEITKTD